MESGASNQPNKPIIQTTSGRVVAERRRGKQPFRGRFDITHIITPRVDPQGDADRIRRLLAVLLVRDMEQPAGFRGQRESSADRGTGGGGPC